MSHDTGRVCLCVVTHTPQPAELERHHIWPLAAGGPDTPANLVWVCPTTHTNVHELLRAWVRAGGEPSWEVRRAFSPYARTLARQGWEAIQAA